VTGRMPGPPHPYCPDPMAAARDVLAAGAQARHPGWRISHGLYGWSGVRDRDGTSRQADSLPGLSALISVAGP
jgi:hypothetical protein